MRRKLRTKRGRQRYALRMETVEPVFGQIKQGRGFRQFLLRGLEKVYGEWSLIRIGHNLLKLFRFGGLTDDNRRRSHNLDNRKSALATTDPPGEVISLTAQISSSLASNPQTGC